METVVENLNPFGRYQKLVLAFIGIPSAFAAITVYSTVFTAAKPKYICDFYNETGLAYQIKDQKDVCNIWSNKTKSIYNCSFDDQYFGNTIITDWDLICGRKALAGLTQTFYMIGGFLAILSGYFGDRYGRKRSTVGFLGLLSIVMVLTQILMLDAVNIGVNAKYVIYCISQMLIGCFVNSVYATGFILLIEFTTHKYHTLFSNIKLLFYIAGELLLLLLAYFVREWKIINIVIAAVTVFVTISIWFLLDESPRWLVTQGKYGEAKKILEKIARRNKRVFNSSNINANISNDESFFAVFGTKVEPMEIIEEKNSKIEKDSTKGSSIREMFAGIFLPRKTLLKTLLCSYVWFSTTLLYFGLSLGISSVDAINPYVLFAFQSIAELIGYWICMFNDKFGRRKTNMLYLSVAAAICLIVSLLPRNKDLDNSNKVLLDAVLVITLISIGKCMVSAAFNTLYIYTSELYPTSVRNFAFLFISSIGRTGSVISPQINLLGDTWKPMPYLIFSILSFISSIFVFILPET